LATEALDEVTRKRPPQIRPAKIDRIYACAYHGGCNTPSHGFDFREFGHTSE
jgi:hypothetical protein